MTVKCTYPNKERIEFAPASNSTASGSASSFMTTATAAVAMTATGVAMIF